MKKNWYAVYTKSNSEIKVAASLTKKKIENYCPFNRIIYRQGNRTKITHEAMFPCFVFVYASEMEIPLVKQTSSVVNFVYWLGNPVIVKSSEIENIRTFTSKHANIKVEKIAISGNANVRIICDPHIDINSKATPGENLKFMISIPSLGYVLTAETEKSNVDILNYAFLGNKISS